MTYFIPGFVLPEIALTGNSIATKVLFTSPLYTAVIHPIHAAASTQRSFFWLLLCWFPIARVQCRAMEKKRFKLAVVAGAGRSGVRHHQSSIQSSPTIRRCRTWCQLHTASASIPWHLFAGSRASFSCVRVGFGVSIGGASVSGSLL